MSLDGFVIQPFTLVRDIPASLLHDEPVSTFKVQGAWMCYNTDPPHPALIDGCRQVVYRETEPIYRESKRCALCDGFMIFLSFSVVVEKLSRQHLPLLVDGRLFNAVTSPRVEDSLIVLSA